MAWKKPESKSQTNQQIQLVRAAVYWPSGELRHCPKPSSERESSLNRYTKDLPSVEQETVLSIQHELMLRAAEQAAL